MPLVLAGPLACLVLAAPQPAYTLETAEAKRIEAVLTYTIQMPNFTAREWVIYAAKAPELPGQVKVNTTMEPGGRPVSELSPLRRPMMLARVPARDRKMQQEITVRVKHQATLMSRRLVPLQGGKKARPLPPLRPEVRRLALAATSVLDFKSKDIQSWLDSNSLRRRKDEPDVGFARRVFAAINDKIAYKAREAKDRRTSAVCLDDSSDCAGLSFLFVSALRAHGIPARALLGRWAESAKPGDRVGEVEHYQRHVIAEFYAEGVGWVPVDLGHRRFGEDPGNFLVLHVDPDILIDSVYFGRKTEHIFQSVSYWAFGVGSVDVTKTGQDWQVKMIR